MTTTRTYTDDVIREYLMSRYDADSVKNGAEASDEEAGMYAGEDDSWLVHGTMPNTNEISWFYAGHTADIEADIALESDRK